MTQDDLRLPDMETVLEEVKAPQDVNEGQERLKELVRQATLFDWVYKDIVFRRVRGRND